MGNYLDLLTHVAVATVVLYVEPHVVHAILGVLRAVLHA